MRGLLSIAAAIISILPIASRADAQTAPTMVFSYDDVQQILTVSLSDNSSFNYALGIDETGTGTATFVGSNVLQNQPGTLGDSILSEWLVSNDDAASQSDCTDVVFLDEYTGNASTDFKQCIADIEADGGTYELGTFGAVTPEQNTPTGLIFTPGTFSKYSDAVPYWVPVSGKSKTPLASGIEAKMTKKGFEVLENSAIPSKLSPKVSKVDGQIVSQMLSNHILKLDKATGDYKFEKNYYFASPSQAAALVFNKLVNGWNTWITTLPKKSASGVPPLTRGRVKTLGELYKHQ